MAPTTDDKLDTLLDAVGKLTEVVGALAQHVALADTGAGAPTPEPVELHLSQDDPYEPLVPVNDDNLSRRTMLAHRLGILGNPAGAELVQHGARGFYRRLDKDPDAGEVRLGEHIPRPLLMLLVEDALLEDPREAADMGLDLLKVWDADEAPAPGEAATLVHMDKP